MRLIPAGAGQTIPRRCSSSRLGAHPRGCGADLGHRHDCGQHRGSSPRVRGRLFLRFVRVEGCGLIPAGAGQTAWVCRRGRCRRAHPRGCGADESPDTSCRVLMGSSPRVRGRLADRVRLDQTTGLIPAGAGQTSSARSSALSTAAHPRGCGADPLPRDRSDRSRGSSPRVRGRPPRGISRYSSLGLIPAGAGQTAGFSSGFASHRAHPRGCGADTAAPGR